MSREVTLSFALDVDGPRPPAIPQPQLQELYSIGGHGARVQILRLANHTGTHLDAPAHVISDGLTIHDFELDELRYGHPVLIDLPLGDGALVGAAEIEPHLPRLRQADLALVRFGRGAQRAADPLGFSMTSPGFSQEGARYLRSQCPALRAIGLDVPSIACISRLEQTMCAHHELLGGRGRRFLIIEDMRLDLPLQSVRQVQVCPWLVTGMDSGPCTVIGRLD